MWFNYMPTVLTKIKLIEKIEEIKYFLKYLPLKLITGTLKNSM